MKARTKEKAGGIVLAIIGAAFTAWNWYTAVFNGYYYRKASVIFPAVLIFGLGLIIFPGYKEERIARGEDISHLQGVKLITARWWVILAAALSAGVLNIALLSVLY